MAHLDDATLVRALLGGQEGAWEEFLRRAADLVFSFTAAVFPEDRAGPEYLRVLERLRADGFAALADFDGRARLTAFLRLRLGDLFAGRLLELFDEDAPLAWGAFEEFYRDDMMRVIARQFPFPAGGRMLPGGHAHEDVYQEICCLLVEHDYRRIRSFDQRGSFAGYVRRVVRNICTDLRRKVDGRRRFPEGIRGLPLLERDVYRLLYWSRMAEEDLGEVLKDPAGRPYPPSEIHRAVATAHAAASRAGTAARRPATGLTWREGDSGVHEQDLRDERPSPEARLVETEQEQLRERLVEKLLGALATALDRLPAESQLYVRLRFYSEPPKPPREIARLLGRPEAEVYRLRERTIAALRARLAESCGGLLPDVRLGT